MLHDQGFRLAGCCGSGTSAVAAELKPGIDTEESRWFVMRLLIDSFFFKGNKIQLNLKKLFVQLKFIP